jgi:serine/threonine protein kinase
MHPRTFGKYRIVKLLPLGGMGRVYLALDSETNRQVALKLIEIGPDLERKEILEAERRGALLQARLCGLDPRVAVIQSYGELDDFFYIEMEYVEGQDLSEILAKRPLGIPFAARIGSDICEVLQHAHTFNAEIDGHQYHGIVHGDIKPRNIRITPDGQVKVLDFGIAKALSLTRKFTTNQFGSSQYSSPERLKTGEVDIASDLWSTAVVLFEIVTGKPYFQAESAAKIEHLIRNYRHVRDFPPNLPERFRAILRKALHPDAALRYPSAAEFGGDLKAFLENRPMLADAASEEDSEKTRRATPAADEEEVTHRAASDVEADDAATRRTSVPAGLPAKNPAPIRKTPPLTRPLTQRQRQIRFFSALVIGLVLALMFYNEYSVWRRASALSRELETERLTDIDSAWKQYEVLAQASVLPVVYSGARRSLQSRLINGADRVITEYRNSEAPTVTEADWVRAQAAIGRALQLDPGDKQIRGRLYICEAHIARIRGTARNQAKLLQDARARFEEARDLLPKSPDPYLGLARLYVYSLKNVEKAEGALREADRRGYQIGRREKGQLADGFKDRADRLMREATRAASLSEEKDYLEQAKQDYRRAEELYRDIVPFGGSAAGLRRVFEQLEFIEGRIESIKHESKGAD